MGVQGYVYLCIKWSLYFWTGGIKTVQFYIYILALKYTDIPPIVPKNTLFTPVRVKFVANNGAQMF